jgi:cell division protein DivIC
VGKKILKILINKYFITTVLFVAWLVFFDNNNILTNLRTRDKLLQFRKDKQFYIDEVRKDSISIQKLLYDTLELEKYAREKYLMKKDNEDVYLVIDTTVDRRQ